MPTASQEFPNGTRHRPHVPREIRSTDSQEAVSKVQGSELNDAPQE
jgi:hypothetical protein